MIEIGGGIEGKVIEGFIGNGGDYFIGDFPDGLVGLGWVF
jgi:hypothetical protein